MNKHTKRYYVGIAGFGTRREVFTSDAEPTTATHGAKYDCTIGPFVTRRGAIFMRDFGRMNPHCQCVDDAERIAAQYARDDKAWQQKGRALLAEGGAQ